MVEHIVTTAPLSRLNELYYRGAGARSSSLAASVSLTAQDRHTIEAFYSRKRHVIFTITRRHRAG
jgi:hypothetical protein